MDEKGRLFLRSEQAEGVTAQSDRHRQILGKVNKRVDAIEGMLDDCREALEKKPVQDHVSYGFIREMEMRRPSISYCEGGRDQWYVIGVDFATNRPIYTQRGDINKRI